ncbi:MAG: VOC family protein [Putridiphycobacter sp.]|nr:VOC family protein [Putridiphycobacter sp.]
MIKGIFETHLYVSDLDRAIDYYIQILDLELAHIERDRSAAFFWINKPKYAMLGLWEKPKSEVIPSHFAFETSSDFVLNEAADFLKSKGLKGYNFFNDGTDKPTVFAWIPAISLYFKDPDGHTLEFIGILEGPGQPELGIISYEDWINSL